MRRESFGVRFGSEAVSPAHGVPSPQRAPKQTCTVGRRQAAVDQVRTLPGPDQDGSIRPLPATQPSHFSGSSTRFADTDGQAADRPVTTHYGCDRSAGQAAASSQQPKGWSNGRGCPFQSGGGRNTGRGLREKSPSGANSPETCVVFGVGDQGCQTPKSQLRFQNSVPAYCIYCHADNISERKYRFV